MVRNIRGLCVLKYYCTCKEVCEFCWLTLEQLYHNSRNGKCKQKNTFLMIQLNTIGITCTYCTAVANLMNCEAVVMHLTVRR